MVWSDRSLFADVTIVLLFGIVGYVLQKGNFPVACLVLGMILGPLMEDNFHRALIISQNDLSIFVASPNQHYDLGRHALGFRVGRASCI